MAILTEGKIKTRRELARIVAGLKRRGKTVAFTNGCFDILHLGHVRYLQDAKRLADVLIVAVNSDSSVKRIKGRGRPINKLLDRLRVLAGLTCVDYLVMFNQDTPLELITKLRPDILVKGGDWEEGKIVGGDFVKSYGGKVVSIPYIEGYSTTSLIKMIKKAN